MRGISDSFAVRAEKQTAISRYVIVDLDIGRIPDILPVSGIFSKVLDNTPVSVSLEFIAVTPQID